MIKLRVAHPAYFRFLATASLLLYGYFFIMNVLLYLSVMSERTHASDNANNAIMCRILFQTR